MLPLILLILAGLSAILYLAFLIVTAWHLRMPPEQFELVSRFDQIPVEVRTYFQMIDKSLPEFASVGIIMKDPRSQVCQYIRLMDHPVTRDLAVACVTQVDTASHLHQVCSLQFVAVFEDGREVLTANTVPDFPLCPAPQTRLTVVPYLADPDLLWRVHAKVVAQTPRAAERKTPWHPEILPWWQSEAEETICRRIQHGHLRVDKQTGARRLTWKCIFLCLMRAWPIKQLRLAYTQWRAKRLLKQLGLPTDYATIKPLDVPKPTGPQEAPPETLFCPSCDYNLTGLSAGHCPECGETFDPAQLAEFVKILPRPVTFLEVFGQFLALLGFLIVLIAVGAVLAYIADRVGQMRGLVRSVGALGTTLFSLLLASASYATSRDLGPRLAVTRARARGSDRSGWHDRSFIRLAWAGVFVLHCVPILIATGIVLFLLLA